jgi:hypothetical protein
MNSTSWLQYFESNRLKRAEPQWHLPLPETGATAAKLARSLSHFALGESGDGRFLLDEARHTYPDDPDYITALRLFIDEEKEHARLLGKLVTRFGGHLITGHWTHSCFRLLRRALGLHFEVQVLVIAELVGTAYYRSLHIRTRDPVLEQVCDLVLRDEARHIEFHSDRFATCHASWLPLERALWAGQFQFLFLAAAHVAWFDHSEALIAVGSRRSEFFRTARRECIDFLKSIEANTERATALPSPST